MAIKDFDKHLAKFKRDNSLAQSPQTDHCDENELKKDPFYIVEKNKDANLEFILDVLQDITGKKGLRKKNK